METLPLTQTEEATLCSVFHNCDDELNPRTQMELQRHGLSHYPLSNYFDHYLRLKLIRDPIYVANAVPLPSSSSTSAQGTTRVAKRKIADMSMEDVVYHEVLYKSRLDHLSKRRKKLEEQVEKERRRIKAEVKRNLADTSLPSCGICLDTGITQCAVTKCGHVFCTQCMINLLCHPLPSTSQRNHKCPLCRTELSGTGAITCMAVGATNSDIFRHKHGVKVPIEID